MTDSDQKAQVPDQSQSLGDANGGKQVSELVEPGTTINWTEKVGKVDGTVKYISDYSSAFGEEMKTGHFFPVKFDAEYYDEDITVEDVDGDYERDITVSLDDPYLILRLENFPSNKIKASLTDLGEEIFTLDFTDTVFDGVGKDAMSVPDQSADMDDSVDAVSKLIDPGVSIAWNGANGKVSGKVHYYHFDNGHFSDKPTGHYMPVVITGYDTKEIEVIGTSGTAKKVDPKWVIRVDDFIDQGKKATFKCEGITIAVLDFSLMELEPPLGEEAIILPTQDRDFGTYGKTSDYLNPNVAISWEGTKGTVTGNILYKEGAPHFSGEDANGNYYPLVLNNWFSGKQVSVTASNKKTDTQTDWIMCLNKVKNTTKKIIVEYNETLVAELDFSQATLDTAVSP